MLIWRHGFDVLTIALLVAVLVGLDVLMRRTDRLSRRVGRHLCQDTARNPSTSRPGPFGRACAGMQPPGAVALDGIGPRPCGVAVDVSAIPFHLPDPVGPEGPKGQPIGEGTTMISESDTSAFTSEPEVNADVSILAIMGRHGPDTRRTPAAR